MAKFRVGDKVRVLEGCWGGQVGVVVPMRAHWSDYDALVDFGGNNNDYGFRDYELELVEDAPLFTVETVASGRITYDFNAFTPAVLVGDTSLHAALRKFAIAGADVEIVVRKKGA